MYICKLLHAFTHCHAFSMECDVYMQYDEQFLVSARVALPGELAGGTWRARGARGGMWRDGEVRG